MCIQASLRCYLVALKDPYNEQTTIFFDFVLWIPGEQYNNLYNLAGECTLYIIFHNCRKQNFSSLP